eukprot:CAMPEP_0203977686 /NCGR_PEP_ID=MMETSP0359-20131031/101738_1 /ASSEMBLY_ACC=CAM_ASM_000338 /TAXON_ID=268821 /ORGANISM="Scrippsiella Hangoei, Strain SHTV-5" /LENGTH=1526 /DNA_ID=CAMNT_0050915895 /DNA_START=21 /DNA_END=4597 /DNA_ORIENTATION=+
MPASAGLQETPRTGQDADPLTRVTRRRIYLQRLVGDGVMAPKKVLGQRTSMRVVVRFLVYLGLATIVILTRIAVDVIYQMNSSLSAALETGSFKDSATGKEMYFRNITDVRHMTDWMQEVLIARIKGDAQSRQYSRKLSLLSFNRVTPFLGTCTDTASFTMTMRRLQTTPDYSATTTERFHTLFPRSWTTGKLPAGAVPTDAEDTSDMLGLRMPVADRVVWKYSSPPHGYQSNGGYFGVFSIHDMNVNRGATYVHLLDYSSAEVKDTAKGICTGLPRSSTIAGADFFNQSFFGANFGSLVLEFTVYNANLQTMSKVTVKFEASFAGKINKRSLHIETIRLDPFHKTMRYFELAYLIMTIGYLLEFGYTFLKLMSTMITDAWTYVKVCSMLMSLLSLGVWLMYTPALALFNQSNAFMQPSKVEDFSAWGRLYKQTSAIAALTIYLRLLEFLSKARARVLLLARTLGMGASNMIIYLCYIFVVFIGFAAFAQNYFAAYSVKFITPFETVLSCFQLFFGKTGPMDTVDGSIAELKVVFYVLFMVSFYFVSVQMFNAIINYAYNRVSEQMEVQFEHERRTHLKKTKMVKMGGAGEGGIIGWLREHVSRLRNKAEKPGSTNKELEPSKVAKAPSSSLNFDNLEDAEKVKVEAFLNKDAVQKEPDSFRAIFLFMIFTLCYVWFLAANLTVYDNYQLGAVVDRAIWRETGRGRWDGMVGLPQAALWMEETLPLVIFNTTSEKAKARAVKQGIVKASTVCLKGWNCIVSTQEPGFPSTKIIRITQRRSNKQRNTGRLNAETPELERFTGGVDNITGQDLSWVLVNTRSTGIAIDPDQSPDGTVESSNAAIEISPALKSFCNVTEPGNKISYKEFGGIVCLLDSNYTSFMEQIKLLGTESFFGLDTSSWVIDFTLQNSNRQLLSHASIAFMVLPSGQLKKHVEVESVLLFSFPDWFDNFSKIAERLAPGIVYITFTIRFLYMLYDSFRKELYRRRHKEDYRFVTFALDFFRLDVFNTLEAVSIGVSLFSGVLFVMWCALDIQVQDKKEEGFCAFLAFTTELTNQASLYNRMSAVNVLMIGARPFKFVRENPRVAKLNQSFWNASNDIFWFVIMLFFSMFGVVMLVYISFGPYIEECSSLFSALVHCFRYLLGDFDFEPLIAVDPAMAAFMFPYLIVMYCVFTNIFFAIIDRHFVAIEAPPFQWKRKLKPFLSRVCRCIEWDEDYVMEQDPNAEKKTGPPSRKDRVKITQREIQAILQNAGVEDFSQTSFSRGRDLQDVCDPDERMEEVLAWAREEARNVVQQFNKMLVLKRTEKNDEHFVKHEVMATFVQKELQDTKGAMEEAARWMRYATRVAENLAHEDQETLAKYIALLERKIQRQEVEGQALNRELEHLETDIDKLRNPLNPSKERGVLDLKAAAKGAAAASGGHHGGGVAQGHSTARSAGDTAPDAESSSSASSDEDRPQKGAKGAVNAGRADQQGQDDAEKVEPEEYQENDPNAPATVARAMARGTDDNLKSKDLFEALGAHRSKRERR